MDRLPPEILRLICIYAREHDTNDLATLRRVSRILLQASTPVLFENLTIMLNNGIDTQQLLSEFHDSGYGALYLEHARTLDLICLRDLVCFDARKISESVKDMRANVFGHIPRVALPFFLERYFLLGVTPASRFEPYAWRWAFDAFWKEDWQPVATLVSRLKCLMQFNYAPLNRFPMPLHEALAKYHPSCTLNIWQGATPLMDPPLHQQTFLNTNPLLDSLPRMDEYCLSSLRSCTALCPANSKKKVTAPVPKAYMIRHLSHLAACRNLRHLEVRLDSRWGTYEEIVMRNEKWALSPPEARAKLESLTISSSGPREEILMDLTSIFDLSTLKSLDFHIYEHPDLLREMAPRLSSLQRLFISLDTYLGREPDISVDNQSIVEAIVAFRPLQYLCLRGVRNVATLHSILEYHGPSLEGLLIESTTRSRGGRVIDNYFKYPAMTPADVRRIEECTPLLRELRLPLKRTKGDRDECAMYKAIGSFSSLRSLLLDLHYDNRTPSIYQNHRPDAIELREILINAATDSDLAQSIWSLIFKNQSSKALRNLTVRPFGSEVFSMPEAYLPMTVGQTFLVARPAFDAFEPLQIKRIAKGAYELEVEHRLMEGDGPNPGRGLPRKLREAVDALWPGSGKWESRWKSFPLEEGDDYEGAR